MLSGHPVMVNQPSLAIDINDKELDQFDDLYEELKELLGH